MRNINHLNSRKPENNATLDSKMFVTSTQCYNNNTFKLVTRLTVHLNVPPGPFLTS